MSIEIRVENNGFGVSASTDRWAATVTMSPDEEKAVSSVFSALGDLAVRVHCERRSDAYLSIVGPDYGDDFCRIKAGARSVWFSLDLPLCGVSDDPRLACVKNKNQRHWKIPLSSVSDIPIYSDLILLSARQLLGV